MKRVIYSIAAAVLAFAGGASAQILVGASFNQTPNTVGVLGETFANYNFSPESGTTGSHQIGTSGVYLEVLTNQTYQGDSSGGANIYPFRGLLYNGAGSGGILTFKLSGLTAGAQYQFVGYSGSSFSYFQGQGSYSFAPGDVLNPGGAQTSFVQGTNYSQSTLTADGAGKIDFTMSGAKYAISSGIGIASVPEPSTFMMLGVVLFAVLLFRWKRRLPVTGT